MARFFRLPILPSTIADADDWVINTDDISDVKRFGQKVVILRKNNLDDFTLHFDNEDDAVKFLNQNFLIFNA